MKTSVLVSIIIPCYNVENYVSRSLDSALNQTYPHTEIICVDNNSTDQTLAVLQDYQSRYPDKIQLFQEPIQGAPAARNLGLKHAKGEWIQFLDADDVLLEKKIEHQIEALASLKNGTDIIVGEYLRIDGEEVVTIKPDTSLPPVLGVLLSEMGITSGNLWKRTGLVRVNGWNNMLTGSQEYELMGRMIKNGSQFYHLTGKCDTLVYKRANSISTLKPSFYYGGYIFRTQFYDFIKSQACYIKYKLRIDHALFYSLRNHAMYNFDESFNAYKKHFPDGYRLKKNMIGTMFYLLYKTFGFRKITFELFKIYLFVRNHVLNPQYWIRQS